MNKDRLEIDGITYFPLFCECPTCAKYGDHQLLSYWKHQGCDGQVFVGSNAMLYCNKCSCSTNIRNAFFSCEACDNRGEIKWFVSKYDSNSIILNISNGIIIKTAPNTLDWNNALLEAFSKNQYNESSIKLFLRPIKEMPSLPSMCLLDRKMKEMLKDIVEKSGKRAHQIQHHSFVKDNVKFVELTFILEDDIFYHVDGGYYIGSNAHLYDNNGVDFGLCTYFTLSKDVNSHTYICSHSPNQVVQNAQIWRHVILSMDHIEFLFVESIMNSLDIQSSKNL